MENFKIKRKNFNLLFDPESLNFSVEISGKIYSSDTRKNAEIVFDVNGAKKEISFTDCLFESEYFKTGVGEGIKTRLYSYRADGQDLGLELETRIWADTFDKLHFELSPLKEDVCIDKVCWPAYFDFPYIDDAYSVLPIMQGNLLYNDVDCRVNGFEPSVFYERMGYMAFFGQLVQGTGYIDIVETPYDAGYYLRHAGKGETALGVVWLSSMRKIGYTRKLCCEWVNNADYNDLCKIYRRYAKEKGTFRTLKEKAAEKSAIYDLIGSPVIHVGALYSVKEGTDFYDRENPDKNYRLQTFSEIENGLKKLKERGLKKGYLHLDGWGKAGYDQQHPDVLPPCEAAGGAAGMKKLADTCKESDILFAIHDQYRDYYTDAATFDENNAILNSEGERGGECRWFGGDQKYLCTALAGDYIKRNIAGIEELGISLDGVYLDVFSVIALEECFDPRHRMTRKENAEYRGNCFRILNAAGLISSSEEPVEWAVPYLDLVHHGPYCVPIDEFPYELTPVPLFNLVYHDCVILPWDISAEPWGLPKNKNAYLYALLNGGVTYLGLDADRAEIERVEFACDFQSKVCFEEMERHEILPDNRERAYYRSYIVEVDFDQNKYDIRRRK